MDDVQALIRLKAAVKNHSDLIGEVIEHARRTPARWLALPLGRRLRWLRIRLGLKQWQAARLAGMTQSRVAKIENGLDVRLSTLRKLLSGYGCELLVLPLSPRPVASLRKRTRRLFP